MTAKATDQKIFDLIDNYGCFVSRHYSLRSAQAAAKRWNRKHINFWVEIHTV